MADIDNIKNKAQSKAKSKVKRKVKSKAKSKVKRIHPMTFVICFLALLLGVGAGIGAYTLISADDCFKLKGDEAYTFKVGADISKYTDEGVKIISFGKDISSEVEVKTNLSEIDDGVYAIDTSEPGEYYMIYTVDDAKFGKIQRVRTISIKGE
ncbi:MAG: hypothetical protein J6V42_06780 [Clostridia bacterium]|nr:hypothetical protein [Clostridia bacterium]